MDIWNSLDNKTQITLIVTALIAIIGWIIAVCQFRIANKLKKRSIIFENRLKIYNEYFHKIDDINDRLMIDFQEFIGPIMTNLYEKILKEPDNSNDALVEMQKALAKITSDSAKTVNETSNELQKLRFIASKKTLQILDEYRSLAQSQIDIIPDLLGSINIQEFENYDTNQNEELKKVGVKLIETRNALEKQMRKDLNID
ncbi:MAG: hypothetical protein WD512_13840 [Candidatus Paceibacterota bacterium]